MSLISKLLRKNTSPARVAGFVLSNFIGLIIIAGAIQFYSDARTLWSADDSFIKSDFLVVNKKVTSAGMWGDTPSAFSTADIDLLRSQPWVRDVGRFSPSDYRVWASVEGLGNRDMSTMLFFESIPDNFVDAAGSDWHFNEGDDIVPIIISKDYLTLYNFGFASSVGLPQMSESLMSGIPLSLTLCSDDGSRSQRLKGRIVGYSNRLNTILVPESFMKWSNALLGRGNADESPSRLIVDVSSPGDVAIKDYLDANGLEVAGDKSGSSAAYLLRIVVGIVMAVGGVITILSFFILMLSMSLLMEKNRDKLHSLLMLGCPLKAVSAPYVRIVVWASACACALAIAGVLLLRSGYLTPIEGLGARSAGPWPAIISAVSLTLFIMGANVAAVCHKVKDSWR